MPQALFIRDEITNCHMWLQLLNNTNSVGMMYNSTLPMSPTNN